MQPFDLAPLIPHESPMRLVDQCLAHTDTALWANAVTFATPFATSNGIHSCVGIEYLAQAAAAFYSLQAQQAGEPKQGMLIASRRYSCRVEYFAADAQLLLYINQASALGTTASNLVKFQGEIHAYHNTQIDPKYWRDHCPPESALVEADLSVYI